MTEEADSEAPQKADPRRVNGSSAPTQPGHPAGSREDLGRLLSLIVHDLRNPTATIGANLSFLDDVGLGSDADEEVPEVLADLKDAVAELGRGLDQLGWIGRWLAGAAPVSVTDGDAAEACRVAARSVAGLDVRVEVSEGDCLRAVGGGGTLCRLLELLLRNARQHAPGKPVCLRARRDGSEVVIEVCDEGQGVAEDVAEAVFTVAGQCDLKGRPDGRYGRVAGLLAARVVADAIGARLSAGSPRGETTFQVRLLAL